MFGHLSVSSETGERRERGGVTISMNTVEFILLIGAAKHGTRSILRNGREYSTRPEEAAVSVCECVCVLMILHAVVVRPLTTHRYEAGT